MFFPNLRSNMNKNTILTLFFEKSGNIRLVRLMINRGYAFVIFTTPDAVEKALNQVKYSEEIFYVKLCCIVIFYLTHSWMGRKSEDNTWISRAYPASSFLPSLPSLPSFLRVHYVRLVGRNYDGTANNRRKLSTVPRFWSRASGAALKVQRSR